MTHCKNVRIEIVTKFCILSLFLRKTTKPKHDFPSPIFTDDNVAKPNGDDTPTEFAETSDLDQIIERDRYNSKPNNTESFLVIRAPPFIFIFFFLFSRF